MVRWAGRPSSEELSRVSGGRAAKAAGSELRWLDSKKQQKERGTPVP
ncbi:MAG: hypothetical protein HFG41_05075 [Coprococcus sp.]|nr:hypothetical protein [Coprococcus sp.]